MKIFSKLLPASKMKLVMSCLGVLALMAFTAVILVEATKAEVVLTADGEEQTIRTHADTIDELLAEAGITVGKHDALSHKLTAKVENGMDITYKEAKKIIVNVDGNETVYHTTLDTVGAFLKEQHINLSEHDQSSHNASDKLSEGLKLTIDKAFQVTINDGKDKKTVTTNGGTVEEILKREEITLSDLDKIKPGLDTQVSKDTPITIVRVEKVTDVVKEEIAYDTEKREDPNLEKGKKRVVAQGEEGVLVKKYEIIKENGKEVSRKLVSKTVEKESEARVVAFGTKEEQLVTLSSETSNSNEESGDSGKVLYMSASAYTASCSGCSGYTSTGINLNANPNMKVVAVDPSVIPLGTKVWVEGYGTAIAGDTGGHILGNRIDLHFATKSQAYAFGRRTVKVKILD
ncbi:ubiquitin-like domain-containing protein [Virgibacillus kekensis]|uniref:Ubiquitin-like domain-containing protein n=1 Tax=Virgibacillus kekensis TaxID=202261 RepID=A0ABV9DJI0_9BACI